MISGNPSSKCQRNLAPDQTDAGPGFFVQKTSSLQGSGRSIQLYPGGPLANFYGNLYNL